jgi:hypothetical protein
MAATATGIAVPLTAADAATSVNVPATAGPAAQGGTGVVATQVNVSGSVTVTASGTITTAPNQSNGPDGAPGQCGGGCFQPSLPRGALIGEIGSGAWQLVGSSVTLNGSGALSLAVNDTAYGDNTGAFTASVSSSSPIATSLSIAASPATVYANSAVTVSTVLTRGGSPQPNANVVLVGEAAGSTTFKRGGSALTDANGAAKMTVHPQVNTTYEWTYAGNNSTAAATSPTKFVGVRTRVTIHTFDPTLAAGQTLVLWGLTSPAKPGVVVTIWRHVGTKNVRIGAVKVHSDGTWGWGRRVRSGKASVFAHIPVTAGNLAGNSVRLKYSAA